MTSISNKFVKIFFLILALGSLQACAFIKQFGGTKFQEAGSIPALEVPPSLEAPNFDESLVIPQTGNDRVSALETLGKDIDATVVPEFVEVTLRREGDLRWIEAEVDPVNVWPMLRNFWSDRGISLEKDEPVIGIMETDWIETVDSNTSQFTGAREVSASRSKYRVRVEREPNAVTNIFLSERKSELQAVTDQGGVWVTVDSDPETEAEVLVNMLEHLGRSREDALYEVANAKGTRLFIDLQDIGGVPVLLVGDQYSRVWRRTGIALDRAGLPIFEHNRSKGIYLVNAAELDLPEGHSLQRDRYEVHLLAQNNRTVITVHYINASAENKIPEDEARLILKQILAAYKVFRTTGTG